MPNLSQTDLDNFSTILNIVKDEYINNSPNYEDKARRLSKHFNEIITKYSYNYKLQFKYSEIRSVPLFELTSRLKKADSLKEKLIKDGIIYKLASNEPTRYLQIVHEEVDDIIGLRYLVSLNCDCENLFKLIFENTEDFSTLGISFINIEYNPQIMKNKRKIFRLKAKFEDILFEIQIKSKIDSAWADMEHILFYKDYNFSYTKNNNKNIMTEIGGLLEKVEDVMLSLRKNEEQYDEYVSQLDFNQHLRKRYIGLMTSKLETSSLLQENQKILFEIFNMFSHDQKSVILSKTRIYELTDFLTFKISKENQKTKLIKNYNEIRRNCIEITIFECLYEDCSRLLNLNKFLSLDNFSNFLKIILRSSSENINLLDTIPLNNYTDWFSNNVFNILSECDYLFNNKFLIYDKYRMWDISIFADKSFEEINALNETAFVNIQEFEKFKNSLKEINYIILKKLVCNNLNDLNDLLESREELDYIEKINDYFNNLKKKLIDKDNDLKNENRVKPQNILIVLLNDIQNKIQEQQND